MRDEDFEIFIEEMGEATDHEVADPSVIEKYRSILPLSLIKIWQEEGWNGYANGLFWIVNPDEYSHLVEMWLEGTSVNEIDTYHVIARSAFGDLFAWGEKYNRKITISCLTGSVIAVASELDVPSDNPDLTIGSFLAMSDLERYDVEDIEEEPFFERSVEKLGALKKDELYGFEPALVLGGSLSFENLTKLKLDVHLTILRQLGGVPRIPY
ncbi:DUF1851 domain-containing protein [Photobacterium sp. CCB-ST2H9]|uniref:GAD-like domain-containing protein n=1 Tax=Photobacterium sp. CCB-ST2H9 TaxID=2912855 RepID=UPI00200642BC|nr:GAD-like domain-containing protein [Photobacterium sp. CCB-ST2H9]UTM59455.1 DUF1851 domain-containing protein [Photobacterium sp. CCB-ST2H9]